MQARQGLERCMQENMIDNGSVFWYTGSVGNKK